MLKPNVIFDTFETTPLGQAFAEAAEIRTEIRDILKERREILDDENPHPMTFVRLFANDRMVTMRQIAGTE